MRLLGDIMFLVAVVVYMATVTTIAQLLVKWANTTSDPIGNINIVAIMVLVNIVAFGFVFVIGISRAIKCDELKDKGCPKG